MAVGDFISASDYNNIRTRIVSVLGTGGVNPDTGASNGSFGYGQTLQSSAVASGATITKTQWDNLRFDIYNVLYHQTGSAPNPVSAALNSVIQYGAAFPNTQYDTLTTTAISNRFDIGSGFFSTGAVKDGSGSPLTLPVTRTSSWTSGVSCEVTMTFSTANEARYFFNSGGKVRFSSSFTPASGAQQETAWQNLLSTAGVLSFGGNAPTINFWNLTTSNQECFSKTTSAPYSSNTWKLLARLSSGSVSSLSTPCSVIFTSVWTDGYTDPGSPPPGDLVTGTLNLTFDELWASGSFSPTGTWSITRPSYSYTSITGS